MKSKNLKTVIYSLAFIGVLAIIGSLSSFTTETYSAVTTKDGQGQWKNLKVLPQDISKDSLMGLMRGYNLALGVTCSHCHVVKGKNLDAASDEKFEKMVARGMIAMTNDMNENYFKPHFPDPKPEQVDVVNCVMCHRGVANPEKYLSQMGSMYKTYDPERDDRKQKIMDAMKNKKD